MDCLFCKIINAEVDAKILYKDDTVLAFDDINPQGPHHKIIIPLKHIATLNDITNEDTPLVGHMVQTAATLAQQLGFSDQGYRVVMNCNKAGGQTVYHIHMHLIGGRSMTWPPG